jgi:hypothetical protein
LAAATSISPTKQVDSRTRRIQVADSYHDEICIPTVRRPGDGQADVRSTTLLREACWFTRICQARVRYSQPRVFTCTHMNRRLNIRIRCAADAGLDPNQTAASAHNDCAQSSQVLSIQLHVLHDVARPDSLGHAAFTKARSTVTVCWLDNATTD